MSEIDDILAALRGATVSHHTTALDGAALAHAARMRSVETQRTGAVAATAALLIGVAGSALPVAAAPSALLGISTPLAPSVLLAG